MNNFAKTKKVTNDHPLILVTILTLSTCLKRTNLIHKIVLWLREIKVQELKLDWKSLPQNSGTVTPNNVMS